MLIAAQDTEGGDVEVQGSSRFDVQVHPCDGHRAEEMAVREGENATPVGGGQRDEVDRPRADLRGRLTARATVLVQLPSRSGFVDSFGGQTLVLSVLDLAKQWRQVRVGKSGDLRGVPCPLQGARVDSVEVQLAKAVAQGCGLLLAVSCER